MPIIRTGRGIVYFAHVPKCAGTAIEGFLTGRFKTMGRNFLNPQHMLRAAPERWSRSSPQHIDAESLSLMFQPGFFDAMFTMVRHPALRLRSVYLYQRDLEEAIDPDEGFSDWLAALPARRAEDPYYLDNHARPMSEMVPEGATIFRLEEGTQQVIDWFDAFTSNQNGPRKIPVRHSRADRLEATGKAPRGSEIALSPADITRIAEMCPEDFDRFGYPVDPADIPAVLAPVIASS